MRCEELTGVIHCEYNFRLISRRDIDEFQGEFMDQSLGPGVPLPAAPAEIKPVFTGRIGEMYGIFIVNLLLTIVTIGIYRFWAKARNRKYLWSHVSVAGDCFEYTGTGRELFFGFLIILFVVVLPIVVVGTVVQLTLGGSHPALMGLYQLAFYAVVLFLIGLGTYAAMRYRLSRTLWRGIRGGLSGSRRAYGLRFLGYSLLSFASFGFCLPLMQIRLSHYLFNHMEFGTGRLAFQASTWPLFRRFVWLPIFYVLMMATIFGTIALMFVAVMKGGPPLPVDPVAHQLQINARVVHLIVAHSWVAIADGTAVVVLAILLLVFFVRYSAASLRYVYSHVTFEGVQLRYDISAWRLFRYVTGNLLITVLTLGLGLPFVYFRMVRIATDNLTIVGTIDFDAIGQNTDPRSRFGEGLASAFDIGAI
jgi:uncharacterized membrane protein YjgN (DUF898 family)